MPDGVPLRVTATVSATEFNKAGGKLLDAALAGAVRITRREQRFVLMREDALLHLIEDARDDRPKSLDDLLRDYDPDKLKKLTRGFLDDARKGKELI
jgi:hypothetical protein